jgi:HK97 family phage portal protein
MGVSDRLAGMLERAAQGLRGSAGAAEFDPFLSPGWWGGATTTTGEVVSPEHAMTLSTVWACVRLVSETVAAMPLHLYELLESGDRRLARELPLYTILNRQPNERQTAVEFWQMMVSHMLLRGNGYARIVSGRRGWVESLEPIHPDLVQVEALDNGRLRYTVNGERIPATRMLHLRGMSLDGQVGLGVIAYARESLGLGIGAERYGSRFFGNDSRPGGVLKTDKDLDLAGRDRAKVDRLRQMWQEAHQQGNQHRVAILPNGLEWQQVGIAPEEAQFLQTREFQAEEVCRWFGVPPHLVGLTAKTTSWGSGIEQMGQGFVTYTLMPHLLRISQAVARDLITDERLFVEHVTGALLRGNLLDRYNAYQVGRTNGWLSVNEIRRLENMNSVDGGDSFLTPLNMRSSDEPTVQAPAPPAPVAHDHYRLLARSAAGRLARKEAAAVPKILQRGEDVAGFYDGHAALVAETLQIAPDVARAWCDQRAAIVADGWTGDVETLTEALAGMALAVAGCEGDHGL